ncbi:MAG: 3-phosphoglycerate dehydrogenase [Acidobacteria bacterium]|nr:MAG: 3-phosphoglycerate dehydrogenase [Acidobacteriota bacterium]RLE22720.1 MAG: 3-phosphoglycerate dehydrogenase [Acidobacteriota bacterium]
MSKKVMVATVKPFASIAVDGIRKIMEGAGYELQVLENYPDQQAFVNAVSDVEALIIRSDKVTREVMDNAPNLKIVVRAGAGYDNVDLEAASEKGIVVMNTPGQNSNAVAELVFGLMIYMARRAYSGKAGTELKGKTLGLQAYGNVGRNVSRIARGFGMEVLAYDPFVPADTIRKDDVEPVDSVEVLYDRSDYVSLHIPAIKPTIKSINFPLMSRMKEGATVINTARKEVIDEEGLKKMLEKRPDFRYVSDIAPDCKDELLAQYPDRVFFTAKKMGAQTLEANVNAALAAANQILGFFEKGDTTFQVNK